MAVTGYFKSVLGGSTGPMDVFPFDGDSEGSVARAWRQALNRAKDVRYVSVWKPPLLTGAWSGCKVIGEPARSLNGMVGEG
jgi:hypothetical protein